jgi:hypothetical protein
MVGVLDRALLCHLPMNVLLRCAVELCTTSAISLVLILYCTDIVLCDPVDVSFVCRCFVVLLLCAGLCVQVP